jgi:hypothetical protein
MMFETWLSSTAELQKHFGVDWEAVRNDPTAFADYVTWNFTALYEELGEMSHELPWAPWKANRGVMKDGARERAIDEAVDALHFLSNVLVSLSVTDAELSEAYIAKQRINRARLGTGRAVPTPAKHEHVWERVSQATSQPTYRCQGCNDHYTDVALY